MTYKADMDLVPDSADRYAVGDRTRGTLRARALHLEFHRVLVLQGLDVPGEVVDGAGARSMSPSRHCG